MKYRIEISPSASGDVYSVYVTTNHDLDRTFHANQKHSVKGADGKKTSVKYKETPRQRCQAYCKQLEAMGYTEEVSRLVMEFRQANALMRELGYSDDERNAAIGAIIDNMPRR